MLAAVMSDPDVDYVLEVARYYKHAHTNGNENPAPFNLEVLLKQFTILCPDFNNIGNGEANEALNFASILIHEIIPKSRFLKKRDQDKVLPLKFCVKNGTKEDLYTVHISTFKNSRPPTETPIITDNNLLLTGEEAGLIAVTVFSQMIPTSFTPFRKLMTPLARAVFSVNHIKIIAKVLAKRVDTVLIIVNESCQNWGQYLPNAKSHVAAVAAICGTRNEELKLKILKDILKQYLIHGKKFDSKEFLIYWENSFAQKTDLESLTESINRIQTRAREERPATFRSRNE